MGARRLERVMPAMPDEESVSLDPVLLKALASDSRRDLLRLLDERRMTLSEMAKRTGLKKATVLEHLRRLVEAGLVRRLDDGERLWIYYELTREGQRLVNPGHRRLYFLLGTIGAAVVVGVLALALLAPSFSSSSASDAASAPLAVSSDDAFASASGTLGLSVANAQGDVDAWLVPASQAAALRNGATVSAARFDLERSASGYALSSAGATSYAALPPGDYVLYARDEAGASNLASLTPLRILEVTATVAPTPWWRGLDGDLEAVVRADGAPLEGTLLLAAGEANLTFEVVDGRARLPASVLDALTPGRHALRFQPTGEEAWIPLSAAVEVREPALALAPAVVADGAPSQVRVLVGAAGRAGAPPAVSLAGEPLPTTSEGGALLVSLPALAPGEVELAVGRVAKLKLHVAWDIRFAFAQRGNLTEILVAHGSGAPAADVAAFLDARALGSTNATGALLAALPAGEHELRFVTPTGASVARGILVGADGVRLATPRVEVANVTAAAGSLLAVVRNGGVSEERVALFAYDETALLAASSTRIPASTSLAFRLAIDDVAPGNVTVRAIVAGADVAHEATVLVAGWSMDGRAGKPAGNVSSPPVDGANAFEPFVVSPLATSSPTAMERSVPTAGLAWLLAALAAATAVRRARSPRR